MYETPSFIAFRDHGRAPDAALYPVGRAVFHGMGVKKVKSAGAEGGFE
jgi:hypothetical protein